MASLIQRNGWYYLQFHDRTKHPARKQIALKTQSASAAERLKHRLEDKVALGEYDPWEIKADAETGSQHERLSDAIRAFLANKSHLSKHTVEAYRSVLESMERHVSGHMLVRDIRPTHLQAWLGTTRANVVTQHKYVRHASVFFNDLKEKGAVASNPAADVKLRRMPHKFPQFLSHEDVERIIAAIREHEKKAEVQEGSVLWLIPIVQANVYLGLRASEVCNLRWSHVSLEERRLLVANSADFTTKSGKERMVPISEPAYAILSELEAERCRTGDDYIFKTSPGAGRLNAHYLSRRFTYFAKRVGLSSKVTFHTTRHTACSWLAMNGASIEAIRLFAGHSTIAVTQRYMHLSPQSFHEQINRAFATSGGLAAAA